MQIGKILFNCYHRPKPDDAIALSEKQTKVLEELKHRLPSTFVTEDGKANAKQAISLSEKILNNDNWAAAWGYDPVVGGMKIYLNGEFGKIVILSPLQSDLDALENKFKREFWAKFFNKYSKQYKSDEEIYEVLLRLWETTFVGEHTEKVSYTKLTKDCFVKAADAKVEPISLPNKCSIAFFYEYQDHHILFLGDAAPDIVAEAKKKHCWRDAFNDGFD